MKSLQPLAMSLVFSLLIVSLHHLGELFCWFALAAIGFGSWQWAMSQLEEESATPVADEPETEQTILPEQLINQLFEEFEKETTGTDLWTEMPQPDAVEKSEPLPLQHEEVADENPTKSQPDQFQLLVQQLESLPQRQGRRKVWMTLCDRLHVKGAGKVRDASLTNKAKFLESQNVKVPDLVKAKVVALRAA